MKIGLVIYGSIDSVSGGYLYDRMLVARLRQSGDTVDVISLPQRAYALHLAGSLGIRLPREYDILIQDELCHPSLLLANVAHDTCPIVSIVHNLRSSERRPGWQNAWYRRLETRYLASVDGFIFNSLATKNSVVGLAGLPKPCVVAVPGGDRLGGCRAEQIRLRAVEGGRLRLVFLANVTELKGLQVLLDALGQLPPEGFSLDVVGSCDVQPGYARKMMSIASGLKVRIVFHGVLDLSPLEAILRGAHVLVVPSYYEGFGIAYLEGMAYGLPAIGTAVGALLDWVSHGKNGYLIPVGDSAALAQCLRQLASDPNLVARMGVSARQYFESQPTWAQSTEAIRDFLIGILRGWVSGKH